MRTETNEEILKQIFAYKTQGLKVIVGGIFVALIIGIFFAWPIIFSYESILVEYSMVSPFKQFLLYFTFPLMNLTMNLCLPRGDYLLTTYGPKQTVVMMASLICIALTFMGYLKDWIILHFILSVFIIAPCIGGLYMVPFQLTWKYFIKQKNHLNSLFQFFIGVGACMAIYTFESKTGGDILALHYDKMHQLDSACYQLDIREAYRHTAILIFVFGVLASFLVTVPAGCIILSTLDKDLETMLDYDLLAYSHEDIFANSDSIDVLDKELPTFAKAVTGQDFKTMVMVVFVLSFLSYMFMGQYQLLIATFGVPYSISQHTYKATILVYSLQRSFVSFCSERYTYQKTISILIYIYIFVTFSLLAGQFFENKLVSMLAISGMVTLVNGIFSTMSIFIPKIFGANIAQAIFTLMLVILAVSNLFSQLFSFVFIEHISTMIPVCCMFMLVLQCYLTRLVKNP